MINHHHPDVQVPATDMPRDLLPTPMRAILGYPLRTGARSLVLVHVPDAEHPFALIDTPSDEPWTPDGDHFVIDDEIDDEMGAYWTAIDHMQRSKRLGRPAEVG